MAATYLLLVAEDGLIEKVRGVLADLGVTVKGKAGWTKDGTLWLVYDLFADRSLQMKHVELLLAVENGTPIITDRRVV